MNQTLKRLRVEDLLILAQKVASAKNKRDLLRRTVQFFIWYDSNISYYNVVVEQFIINDQLINEFTSENNIPFAFYRGHFSPVF